MLSAVTNHIWQSTLFAVVIGLLTLMLRHNSARIRYILWFSASMKFLVPFALLAALGSSIPHQAQGVPVSPGGARALGVAIDRIFAPMTQTVQVIVAAPLTTAPTHPWLMLLGTVWACGVLGIVGYWMLGWTRIRRVRSASRPSAIAFPIPVRTSTEMHEPAVAGIVHPVLLIPEGLEGWLSSEQLRAVLAHEFCHVRRHDNLKAALHGVVEGLFWFHPLVWWLETRLAAERERACDEEVLAAGHSARIYAEGIVRVCQEYLQTPLRSTVGMAGGNLAKRIDAILNSPRHVRLSALQLILLGGMASAVVAGPVVSGHLEAPAMTASGAARLPQEIWQRLEDSDWPSDQEMFQRNIQLIRPGPMDFWGSDMERQLKEFFASESFAAAPEAAGTQILAACREVQCQIQVAAPLPTSFGKEVQTEVVVDDLRRQPLYRSELIMTVGESTVANGKEYLVQYFDRKSHPFDNAASQGPVSTPSPGQGSARSDSTETPRADIYRLMIEQHKGYPEASRWVGSLMHAHEKVVGAEDDPDWARPTERRIRDAILADPAAANMDIRAVACRKAGCEVQWFDTSPPAKRANPPAWIQVVDHIKESYLGATVEMDANFGSQYGDVVIYLTTFKRKPNRN